MNTLILIIRENNIPAFLCEYQMKHFAAAEDLKILLMDQGCASYISYR